jgi:8-amino-3,8-dideoxy-alpha-D-manno-octulosonate transaminase
VPVFCDCDETLNLDAADLERVVDDEVGAIIAVPITGVPCDMDSIMGFARKRSIPVIEDVAQSCGVRFRGRYAGMIGEIGTYSFQMNKILTAGEGGAVATARKELFERAIRYHDQGLLRPFFRERYGIDSPDADAAFAGQNYRMSEITGAVLAEQWKKLDGMLAAMRINHRSIREGVSSAVPSMVFRSSPDPDGDIGCTMGMILPTAEKAGRFCEAGSAENLGTYMLYGGQPVYMNACFAHQRSAERGRFPYDFPFKQPVSYGDGLCPRAEDLVARTVFVPVSWTLTDTDIEQTIAGLFKVSRWIGVN